MGRLVGLVCCFRQPSVLPVDKEGSGNSKAAEVKTRALQKVLTPTSALKGPEDGRIPVLRVWRPARSKGGSWADMATGSTLEVEALGYLNINPAGPQPLTGSLQQGQPWVVLRLLPVARLAELHERVLDTLYPQLFPLSPSQSIQGMVKPHNSQGASPGAGAEDTKAYVVAAIEAYVAQQQHGASLSAFHGAAPPCSWFCQPLAMSAQARRLLDSADCAQLALVLRQQLVQSMQGPGDVTAPVHPVHHNGRPQSPIKPQHPSADGSPGHPPHLGKVLNSLAASMSAYHRAGSSPLNTVLDSFRATGSSRTSSTTWALNQGSMWPASQHSSFNDLSVIATPVLLSVDTSAGQPACSSGGGLELAVLLEFFSYPPEPSPGGNAGSNNGSSRGHKQLVPRAPNIPGPFHSDNSSLSGANAVRLFGELGQGGAGGAVAPASVPRLLRGITVLDEVPVLATLIEFDGAVLYQNDGSLRYFGDLTVPGAAHSLYSRHVIAGNKAMGLSRDKKDSEDLTASRALLSTLFSTRKDLLQELLSEAELGFAWRRVLPVPQGFDSGHLSIALLKRLNAASQSHVSAAGLEQVEEGQETLSPSDQSERGTGQAVQLGSRGQPGVEQNFPPGGGQRSNEASGGGAAPRSALKRSEGGSKEEGALSIQKGVVFSSPAPTVSEESLDGRPSVLAASVPEEPGAGSEPHQGAGTGHTAGGAGAVTEATASASDPSVSAQLPPMSVPHILTKPPSTALNHCPSDLQMRSYSSFASPPDSRFGSHMGKVSNTSAPGTTLPGETLLRDSQMSTSTSGLPEMGVGFSPTHHSRSRHYPLASGGPSQLGGSGQQLTSSTSGSPMARDGSLARAGRSAVSTGGLAVEPSSRVMSLIQVGKSGTSKLAPALSLADSREGGLTGSMTGAERSGPSMKKEGTLTGRTRMSVQDGVVTTAGSNSGGISMQRSVPVDWGRSPASDSIRVRAGVGGGGESSSVLPSTGDTLLQSMHSEPFPALPPALEPLEEKSSEQQSGQLLQQEQQLRPAELLVADSTISRELTTLESPVVSPKAGAGPSDPGAPTYIDVLEGITEDYETEDEGKHGGDDKLPAVCWHEVQAVPILDPVSGQQVLLVLQTDITGRAELEARMAALTESQLQLLECLFPRHVLEFMVAQNPAEGNQVEMSSLANSHENVTILFTDIVGFTSMSKEVAPHQVMSYLNELFTIFDELVDQYQIYKVETAGDAYLAAGGLMTTDEDGFIRVDTQPDPVQGAMRILQFGKALLRSAKQVRMPHNGQQTQVRVGIHTGPVVTGLIGTKLPKYSVFGDTMNTASRMESTCKYGCIQVSSTTFELIKDIGGTTFTPTGGVTVKGKGVMSTFLWDPELHPDEAAGDDDDAAWDMLHSLKPDSASGGAGGGAAPRRGLSRLETDASTATMATVATRAPSHWDGEGGTPGGREGGGGARSWRSRSSRRRSTASNMLLASAQALASLAADGEDGPHGGLTASLLQQVYDIGSKSRRPSDREGEPGSSQPTLPGGIKSLRNDSNNSQRMLMGQLSRQGSGRSVLSHVSTVSTAADRHHPLLNLLLSRPNSGAARSLRERAISMSGAGAASPGAAAAAVAAALVAAAGAPPQTTSRGGSGHVSSAGGPPNSLNRTLGGVGARTEATRGNTTLQLAAATAAAMQALDKQGQVQHVGMGTGLLSGLQAAGGLGSALSPHGVGAPSPTGVGNNSPVQTSGKLNGIGTLSVKVPAQSGQQVGGSISPGPARSPMTSSPQVPVATMPLVPSPARGSITFSEDQQQQQQQQQGSMRHTLSGAEQGGGAGGQPGGAFPGGMLGGGSSGRGKMRRSVTFGAAAAQGAGGQPSEERQEAHEQAEGALSPQAGSPPGGVTLAAQMLANAASMSDRDRGSSSTVASRGRRLLKPSSSATSVATSMAYSSFGTSVASGAGSIHRRVSAAANAALAAVDEQHVSPNSPVVRANIGPLHPGNPLSLSNLGRNSANTATTAMQAAVEAKKALEKQGSYKC